MQSIFRSSAEECGIFCDESSHTGHQYMVLGGVYFFPQRGFKLRDLINSIESKVIQERQKERVLGEVKWSKVPKKAGKYFEFYKRFLNFYLKQEIFFSCLVVDTTTTPLSHATSMFDEEIGFYKFYYQLLANNIIRRLPQDIRYRIFLDYKPNRWKDSIETLERVLNAKMMGFVPSEVRERLIRIEARRSHGLNLLQLTDLLTGAVAASWNKKTTTKTKLLLIEHLEKKEGIKLNIPTRMTRKKLNIWLFDPQKQKTPQGLP